MSSTRLFRLLAAMSVGLGVASCAALEKNRDPMAELPGGNFPLATTTEPVGIRLAPHSFGLSTAQAEALRNLVADWKASGEGMILIEAPPCACEDGSVTAYDAKDALIAFGAPEDRIRLIGYDAPPTAPIRVSFQRVTAQVYDCAAEWDRLTITGYNQPRYNLGCAVNSNLAAMIENPADINRPRATDPYDAVRRQVVIERYRQGEATGSERDAEADATISNVGN